MRNRDYRDIHRTVRNAIHNGDIEQIGHAVENHVQEITDEINEILENLRTQGRNAAGRNPGQGFTGGSGAPGQAGFGHIPEQGTFRRRMPGLISGIVFTIIGAIFGSMLLITDIALLAGALVGELPADSIVVALSVITPLTAGSFFLMGYGIVSQKRARRFARYRDAIGGAAFCTIAKLAELVGEDPQRIRKDLKKMISTGVYPEGHLDRNETCFMVDDITYEEFLEAERNYMARMKAKQEEEQKTQADPKVAELEAVKKEGNDYLKQIRAVNDALPEKEISDKLDQLENVTARIFACVAQHPEKLPDIRSFMRYYLPTTLKLVKAYQEFDEQPVQGENIKKAKTEIEHALDTVNVAFANLLDKLFEDDVLDISADVSTLEMLLKQGGLTGSDFEKVPDNGGKE
ncbi:5-bromo-4-chloroindolyl phosphate hydrolysis family protein [Thermocaproicibacter melissae]|jgi:5-bromo-4-chloroindolyl phosphate hydrolysis protein|uniref:5-bromo-4-chloroindolyl phosphate hydrolysis family protein n=1 Tax=Thermocaproicibacter melissae TaxID=2966552 RepID=UPI0024B27C87|nr:5-bromo-4-chloroindolyl phosphate hydrolysis family protein [Thermocaproicibacter melissae]WBY63378.1 5-bromo-4-chloroindolyl phosphate hydrolysis family protein [Thermocaproicibacter melissae]